MVNHHESAYVMRSWIVATRCQNLQNNLRWAQVTSAALLRIGCDLDATPEVDPAPVEGEVGAGHGKGHGEGHGDGSAGRSL